MLVKADFLVFYLVWITMAQLLAQEEKENVALKDLLSKIDLDELMKKDEPPLIFPKTLEEFEYAFNEHGQLRHTTTGEPFIFNYKEDMHRWNQKRYEALGEVRLCGVGVTISTLHCGTWTLLLICALLVYKLKRHSFPMHAICMS